MSIQGPRRLAAWVATVSLLSSAVDPLSADVITLNGGGVVHGNVVVSGSSKTVALTTSAGTLIIFERQAVKSVTHGTTPPQKSAAVKRAAKPKLMPAEAAWMPKVRSLVERAFGTDRDQRRRAVSELLKIDDENAIPALSRHLADSPNDEARRLYMTILRNIPGSKAVYCLVMQSLFDRSPNVRDTARKAIGQRADLARPLYIQALKSGNLTLASLAAKGIAEIGDPNGESVPYLIDAMDFQTLRVVATSAPVKVMGWDRLTEIVQQNVDNAQPPVPASTRIIFRPPAPGGHSGYDSPAGMGGSPVGYANITFPPLSGPMNLPMFDSRYPQNKSGGSMTVSTPVTMWDIMNTPTRYSTGVAAEKDVNPVVYDTLIQLTGQQLGDNVNNWRRWWINQVKNRALQKSKPGEPAPTESPGKPPVTSKSTGSPDVPRSR